jgi:DNA-binding transcriptional ArsR family regulator
MVTHHRQTALLDGLSSAGYHSTKQLNELRRMYDQTLNLDSIFSSLADPTRRDILRRVAGTELTVSEIAAPYSLSLAAISKHLKILEQARLIMKRRRGKQQVVSLSPPAFADAAEYLDWYRRLWEQRFDALEAYLNKDQ